MESGMIYEQARTQNLIHTRVIPYNAGSHAIAMFAHKNFLRVRITKYSVLLFGLHLCL